MLLLLLDLSRAAPADEEEATEGTWSTAGCSSLNSAGIDGGEAEATPESRCKSSSSSLPLTICFF